MIKVLKDHKYAQCTVTESPNGNLVFRSYHTDVIIADKMADGSYLVNCTGTYSQTTRRQISWFLREYFPTLTYADMRSSSITGECFPATRA